jgi:hypothetical protein
VGLFTAGAHYIGRTTKGFDESAKARDTLEQRYGKPADFTPAPDGAMPAVRMEAFLKVRDAMAASREAMAGTFSRLPVGRLEAETMEKKSFLEKMTLAFSIGKEALSLAPQMGDFFNARDQALLEANMGMGEYSYIYCVAYYSWLKHKPSDGPATASHLKTQQDRGEFRVMGPRVLSRVRGELTEMLEHQLAALPPGAPGPAQQALKKEIDAMRDSFDRLPWQDGVPDAIAASLQPYRERLEAAYNPSTNPFELARTTQRGKWSYQSD